MVDINQVEKNEKEKVEGVATPDLGLPKPVDATMHEALKSTVETMRQERQVEQPTTPETTAETIIEKVEVKRDEPSKLIETTVPTTAQAPITIQTKDELVEEIEGLLSENLADDYMKMTPELKIKFKKKGEVTAIEISKILKSSKIKIKKIINLILDWLKLIPGVNKYFLAQEAKIKSDKVMMLRDEIIKEKGEII